MATTRFAGCRWQNTQDNLTFMTQAAQKAGAKVLLVGAGAAQLRHRLRQLSRLPRCLKRCTRTVKAAVVPFFLKGVADADDPNPHVPA